jgi:hypoxanthine phosphoribosyltransferase
MLINPVGRTMEGLINSSKKSILKAETNFVLEKVPNKRKLKLKVQLSYRWENNYRWIAGRKKRLPSYGSIDDYLFKKLADEKVARPYKMYSEWDYYLTDSISLLKTGVDSLRDWPWDDFCMFENV